MTPDMKSEILRLRYIDIGTLRQITTEPYREFARRTSGTEEIVRKMERATSWLERERETRHAHKTDGERKHKEREKRIKKREG